MSKQFGDLEGDMKSLSKGGKEAASVYDKITKETKDMNKALSAMAFIEQGLYKDQDELNGAYEDLGSYLGMSIDNAQDFLAAQGYMQQSIGTTGSYLSAMIQRLIAAGAISIDSGKVTPAFDNIAAAAQ